MQAHSEVFGVMTATYEFGGGTITNTLHKN